MKVERLSGKREIELWQLQAGTWGSHIPEVAGGRGEEAGGWQDFQEDEKGQEDSGLTREELAQDWRMAIFSPKKDPTPLPGRVREILMLFWSRVPLKWRTHTQNPP